MKKIFSIICICLLSLISTGFSQEIIVRVPLGNTYPPFFIQDENDRWGGISIELAEILLKEADFKPIYKPLPFPRSLAYIRDGRIDLMLNLSITDERKEFTYFIGPQLDETVVLVVKKDSDLKILCLDDIKKLPKPIGIERGKVYGPAFEKKRKEDKDFNKFLDEVTEVDLNEKKLNKNRISAFLGYGYNTYYRIKTNPSYKNFKVHPFIINKNWVYFGFSKKAVSEETLSRLTKAYERAHQKGLFEKVRQQYILK